jgi:hypothetical protein
VKPLSDFMVKKSINHKEPQRKTRSLTKEKTSPEINNWHFSLLTV